MKLTLSSLLLSLILLTSTATSTEVNTGNILNNSTFGTGETTSTTGWSTSGDDGIHTHGEWGFPYQTGMDDSGGVLAFEGHEEDNVYQDVDLVGDGHLTQHQMNQGFTSTMAADVWFWNNIENTLTLKQTITGADGSVSTQVREITGTSGSTGNKFTNYTNVHIENSNTQTDITIRAELFNETAGTAYDDSHRGPDVDNVTLNITYTDLPPINEDAQEAIDDIEENIPDIPEDIFEEPDFTFEEEYFTWEEDFYFDDSFTMEEEFSVYEMPEEFEIIEMPEEFEEMEMPADMEDAFTVVSEEMPEMEMTEEMEEEFVEMEMDEELPEMEEMQEEPAEMEVAEEESVDIETETEEDTMKMPEEEAEEMEVAENEDTMEDPKEDEKSSEGSEETLEEESGSEESVSETASNEEETVGDTDVADKGGIKTKNIEVSKNIKIKNVDVGEIKITVNPKDIFKEVVNLDSYSNKDFYKDKGLQYEVNDDFFNQASMIAYNKEIYENVTLVAYIQTDPVTVYKRELEELAIQKAGIMLELKLLRGN